MQDDAIVIVGMARTPIGNFLGELKDFPATDLGGYAIEAAYERAGLQPADIHEVIMGCVLPAGLGQAPARQAAILAKIPHSTPCTTINKVCGSGMKAVMLAHDLLRAGTTDVVVAGGMENMSRAPHLLTKSRHGYRLGHQQIYDHMSLDGLEDAYDKGKPMGYFAESCAQQYRFTREQQDEYAKRSVERAQQALEKKLFAEEIVPLKHKTKHGERIIDTDERPFSVHPEKLPKLHPVFQKEGSVTAGNSSSIADGAAALVLTRESVAKQKGLQPIARILAFTSTAKAPAEFATAPIDAVSQLLKKLNWKIEDVDLFEINEAFAVVTLAAMHDLKIPAEKLNIHGGGIALGHPIGATGARIIVTLLAAMKHHKLKRGIASLCIGGGEATAIAFEMV